MSQKPGFLADFGKHIVSTTGSCSSRTCVVLDADSISRYLNEYHSLTGGLTQDGIRYVATFDFTAEAWSSFAKRMRSFFYLDLDRLLGSEGHVTLEFKPRLFMHIDLDGKPATLTESEVTDEEFVPIVVERVTDVGLVSSQEDILRRHTWWVERSNQLVEVLGEPIRVLSRTIQRDLPFDARLTMDQFHRNMLACFIARNVLAGENVGELIEFITGKRWITSSKRASIESLLAGLKADSCADHSLTSHWLSLLVWYVSVMIYSGAETDSIEPELVDSFRINPKALEPLIRDARYCMARPTSPPLRGHDDVLEREIAVNIVPQHEGIETIIKQRLLSYPALVWKHPELGEAVQLYVRYDVLRQIHKSSRSRIVGDEIAARCEDNIRRIVEWLKMFAPIEMELFIPITNTSK